MKEDVTFNPVDVGLFGSQAVMLHPEHLANLFDEFGHVRNFNTNPGFIPQSCGSILVRHFPLNLRRTEIAELTKNLKQTWRKTKMKRLSTIFFFATLFCLMSISTFAQNVTYLDADYKPATAANYTYKRVLKFKDLITHAYIEDIYGYNPHWNVQASGLYRCSLIDYYKTGETALVLSVITLDGVNCSNWSPAGEAIYYYKNGKIKRKEFYKNGKLNGTVIYYDEEGTEKKREEYFNGKLIESNKFAAPADSPIIGTWKNVECYNNDCSVKDYGYYKSPPTIVRTSTYLYSQNGIVESIHQDIVDLKLGSKGTIIKGNWKYTSKSATTGILEEYQGEDLVERGTVKFLNRNQLEYTITFSQNSDAVGRQTVWTRQ